MKCYSNTYLINLKVRSISVINYKVQPSCYVCAWSTLEQRWYIHSKMQQHTYLGCWPRHKSGRTIPPLGHLLGEGSGTHSGTCHTQTCHAKTPTHIYSTCHVLQQQKQTYQLHTLHLPHTTGKVSQQLQPNVNTQHLNMYKYSKVINMTIAVQHKHAASLTQQGTNLKPAAQYKYTKPVSHNRETTLKPAAQHKLSHTATLVRSHGV